MAALHAPHPPLAHASTDMRVPSLQRSNLGHAVGSFALVSHPPFWSKRFAFVFAFVFAYVYVRACVRVRVCVRAVYSPFAAHFLSLPLQAECSCNGGTVVVCPNRVHRQSTHTSIAAPLQNGETRRCCIAYCRGLLWARHLRSEVTFVLLPGRLPYFPRDTRTVGRQDRWNKTRERAVEGGMEWKGWLYHCR